MGTTNHCPPPQTQSYMTEQLIEQYSENINYLNPTTTQKNSPLGPQKVNSEPENKSKSKVRIKGTIDNKSCCNI